MHIYIYTHIYLYIHSFFFFIVFSHQSRERTWSRFPCAVLSGYLCVLVYIRQSLSPSLSLPPLIPYNLSLFSMSVILLQFCK